MRVLGGCRADLRIRVGEQSHLHGERPVDPGPRNRGAQAGTWRLGERCSRPTVRFLQIGDADPHLDVHHGANEVCEPVANRLVRMHRDSSPHLRGDPLPVKSRCRVGVAVHQQSLDNGVLQPSAAQGHAVSSGGVHGQAHQDVPGCCRVPCQPGQSRMGEACHAPNVVAGEVAFVRAGRGSSPPLAGLRQRTRSPAKDLPRTAVQVIAAATSACSREPAASSR